jgi:hypothetical protein
VNLTHDSSEAFEGLLWSSRGGWVTLTDVSALKAGAPPAKLPSAIVLHRDRIAYFQVSP